MRFPHELFLNTPNDCDRLRAGALLGVAVVPFAAFTIAAHGDPRVTAPVRLDLYASAKPSHNEHPVAVYELIDGVLVLRPKVDKPKRARAPEPLVSEVRMPISDKGPMIYKEDATIPG